jgi:hypothetical protein
MTIPEATEAVGSKMRCFRMGNKYTGIYHLTVIPLILTTQCIVTDLIRALPGNGSVNSPTYTGG